MKKSFIIIFVIVYAFITKSYSQDQWKEVNWTIELLPSQDDSLTVTLRNTFTSQDEIYICLADLMSTMPEPLSGSEICSMSDSFFRRLHFPQYVIESNHGECETWAFNNKHPKSSNTYTLSTAQYVDMNGIVDLFYLEKGKRLVLEYSVPIISLKLTKGVERIRLHYFQRDCKEAEIFWIISNWVDVPTIE